MESSQSPASAQHGLTQNEPHNATKQAPHSENQIKPLELEDSEEEVEHVNNKRPKLGRSFVWDHMVRTRKVVDGKAKFIAICNICKADVLAHPNKNGTSSCRNHLRQQCKNSLYYMKGAEKGQSILTNEAMVGGTLGYRLFNQKSCEDVLNEFMIRDAIQGS
ncbi:uncharacterized protein [Pyrus communis]|uniref:uncharacterized protein n=1 Tax=Pyrus communis TaxID=23211 RepID=UPI0035C06B47